MIPKIIHYCWFGGKPLPDSALRCIESWKKFLPDYEIKRWDETNFNVHIIPYTAEAYMAKKYAFVSDYARFWILYREGGVYFDTDVELIKSPKGILYDGPFMGCQQPHNPLAKPNAQGIVTGEELEVNPGLGVATPPRHPLYKELLDSYQGLHFIHENGTLNLTTVVTYTTRVLCRHGLVNSPDIQNIEGIRVYPCDFFNPKSFRTGKITLTPRTVSIHHFAATWHGPKERLYLLLYKLFGEKVMNKVGTVIYKLTH
jgi:hypothetical protein